MDVTIRPAVVADAPRLGEVHVQAWRWAYRRLMPDDLLDSLRPESRARAWESWLSEPSVDGFEAWVAEADGEIVGFASSKEARDDDLPSATAELLTIYLLEPFLGKGLGHAMLTEAEASWRAAGYESAVLWVLESNARTRTFYEDHGWVTDGSTKMQDLGSGEETPVIRYTKALA